MGLPISPVMANIFTGHHGCKWLSDCPPELTLISYSRYVNVSNTAKTLNYRERKRLTNQNEICLVLKNITEFLVNIGNHLVV